METIMYTILTSGKRPILFLKYIVIDVIELSNRKAARYMTHKQKTNSPSKNIEFFTFYRENSRKWKLMFFDNFSITKAGECFWQRLSVNIQRDLIFMSISAGCLLLNCIESWSWLFPAAARLVVLFHNHPFPPSQLRQWLEHKWIK